MQEGLDEMADGTINEISRLLSRTQRSGERAA